MTEPKYGVYAPDQMSSVQYHAVGLPWVSSHRLATFSRWGAATVTYETDNPAPMSSALSLGAGLHSRILTPHHFKREFKVWTGDRRTKAGKEEWAKFQLNMQGADVLTKDQANTIEGMAKAVNSHPTLGPMVEDATQNDTAEMSLFTKMQGLDCKGRIDALCNTPAGVCLLDLKTNSRSMAVDDLVRTCANYGYIEQMAFYLRLCTECGINVHRVMIGFIGSNPPHPVRVCEITTEWLDAASKVNDIRLHEWKTADWDCPEDHVEPIADLEMPAWYGSNVE
ncbi:MAG: hypothetical protein CMK81_00755 [Pseudomonadales bacterium]|nr:hypothetical protein [Pseudomonadales bacterium]